MGPGALKGIGDKDLNRLGYGFENFFDERFLGGGEFSHNEIEKFFLVRFFARRRADANSDTDKVFCLKRAHDGFHALMPAGIFAVRYLEFSHGDIKIIVDNNKVFVFLPRSYQFCSSIPGFVHESFRQCD